MLSDDKENNSCRTFCYVGIASHVAAAFAQGTVDIIMVDDTGIKMLDIKTMEKQKNIEATNIDLQNHFSLKEPFTIPSISRGSKFTPPKKKRKKKNR